MSAKRGLIDRITNRDLIAKTNFIIAEQAKTIDKLESDVNMSLAGSEMMRIAMAGDILTPGHGFDRTDLYGSKTTFGFKISNYERRMFSKREPILKWIVYWIAQDIFDNWFRVVEVGKEDDDELDRKVQPVLDKLNAKFVLTRLIVFERRYGTAILLCAYTGEEAENWKDPLYEESEDEEERKKSLGSREIKQISPYPLSKFSVTEHITDDASLKLGWPLIYSVDRGTGINSLEVHYSRVIHAATRLDEHPYLGDSVMDGLWDDVTGFRNVRWGVYQMYWRYISGFPHFKFPGATKTEIDKWIASGAPYNFLARSFLASGGDPEDPDDVEFKGMAGVALDPTPGFEMSLAMMSMGSRVPKDILIGASAGSVVGSETNLRAYDKFISSEQIPIDPIPIDLIKRLMDTGQIEHDYEAKPIALIWNRAFKINEKDQATIRMMDERANEARLKYMTYNEVRKMNEEGEVEGGDVIPSLLELQVKILQASRPQPGPGGFSEGDTLLQASGTTHTLLWDKLNAILGKVRYGKLSDEDARDQARAAIQKAVDESHELAVKRLEDATGLQINAKSPLAEGLDKELVDYYMGWFEKGLTDAKEMPITEA